MSAIPTRRLFVYIAAGLVVLVVGTLGLVSMRSGVRSTEAGVVIEAGGARDGALGLVADAGGGAGLEVAGGSIDPTGLTSSTTTTQVAQIFVQVAGAVRRPGVYQMGRRRPRVPGRARGGRIQR